MLNIIVGSRGRRCVDPVFVPGTTVQTIMSKKILVVDDSKTALMMEREILERRTTYQCVTASDGLEAVEKAQLERRI